MRIVLQDFESNFGIWTPEWYAGTYNIKSKRLIKGKFSLAPDVLLPRGDHHALPKRVDQLVLFSIEHARASTKGAKESWKGIS